MGYSSSGIINDGGIKNDFKRRQTTVIKKH